MTTASGKTAAPATILLVSDNLQWRQQVRASVLEHGWAAMPAIRPQQALTLFSRFAPELILLDAQTATDAASLCRQLRNLPAGQGVPILCCTASGEHTDLLFAAGATDLVSWPLNWSVLNHQIPRHIKAAEALREHHARNQSVTARMVGVGHWQWDANSDVFVCSPQIRRMIPQLPADATLEHFLMHVPPESRQALRESFHIAVARRQPLALEHTLNTASQGQRRMMIRGQLHARQRPGLALLAGSLHDISDTSAGNTAVHRYDSLTGLLNGRSFATQLKTRVRLAAEAQQHFALLHLDLDDFGRINDRLGRANADAAIAQAATVLQKSLDEQFDEASQPPVLARLRDDEFAILLPQVDDAEQVARCAGKLLRAFDLHSQVRRFEERLSASIGIALYPQHGHSDRTLTLRADTAMHLAKSAGKGRYRLASREIVNRHSQRDLSRQLDHALRNNEFTLNYQPQISLQDGEMHGAEALLRWQPDRSNLVMPGRFLAAAENLGLMQDIDAWVIRTALRNLHEWQRGTDQPLSVSVNLSLAALQHGQSLLDTIERSLQQRQLNPAQLTLEIDERVVLEHSQISMPVFHDLAALGCQVVLDNFGAALCSLSSLKRLNLSALKIARPITRDLSAVAGEPSLLRAMANLAHDLDLQVIAQGIESRRQLELLQELGYDFAQGFFIGKPATAKQLQQLLQWQNVPVSALA